jgi:hypothetical protein
VVVVVLSRALKVLVAVVHLLADLELQLYLLLVVVAAADQM